MNCLTRLTIILKSIINDQSTKSGTFAGHIADTQKLTLEKSLPCSILPEHTLLHWTRYEV
ncbi:hypothetical protein [Agriterribacter humi]|uniref:hypothetical protein n=1 Tax=Agriterribacter humi TaxID=1104781 RepID=UPI00126523DD|nr:hypothetical protein [Agriterribacter humi]